MYLRVAYTQMYGIYTHVYIHIWILQYESLYMDIYIYIYKYKYIDMYIRMYMSNNFIVYTINMFQATTSMCIMPGLGPPGFQCQRVGGSVCWGPAMMLEPAMGIYLEYTLW